LVRGCGSSGRALNSNPTTAKEGKKEEEGKKEGREGGREEGRKNFCRS
jgi:hypothetical protein